MIGLLAVVGGALGFLLVILVLVSVITTFKDWKHYKDAYALLPQHKWVKLHNDLVCSYTEEGVSNTEWWIEGGAFRLNDDVYLFNDFITYFSPYSFYYLCKFNKWFNENKDAMQIADWQDLKVI